MPGKSHLSRCCKRRHMTLGTTQPASPNHNAMLRRKVRTSCSWTTYKSQISNWPPAMNIQNFANCLACQGLLGPSVSAWASLCYKLFQHAHVTEVQDCFGMCWNMLRILPAFCSCNSKTQHGQQDLWHAGTVLKLSSELWQCQLCHHFSCPVWNNLRLKSGWYTIPTIPLAPLKVPKECHKVRTILQCSGIMQLCPSVKHWSKCNWCVYLSDYIYVNSL